MLGRTNITLLSTVVTGFLLQAPLTADDLMADTPSHMHSAAAHTLTRPPARRFMKQTAGRMPFSFVPNVGQVQGATRFLGTSKNLSLSLERSALTFGARIPNSAAKSSTGIDPQKGTNRPTANWRTASAHLDFIGTDPESKIEGLDAATAKVNYFVGNDPAKWKSNVPIYSRVRYRNLYPGVDMLFYGKPDGSLEYDLVVAANADPEQIRFHVSGEQKAKIDGDGNLQLDGAGGDLMLARPMLYQDIDHGKKAIAGNFSQVADNEFAFRVEGYDPGKPLIIDPTISLLYSTYIGGRHEDDPGQLVVDAQNNAYLVGYSASEDFPVSGNAYQPIRSAVGTYTYDATVLKFSSSGVLLYSTFIGGTGNDYGYGLAVDGAGNAYISGTTTSTNFPTTAGAYSTTPGSGFLAEISPDGSTLEYSSYFPVGINTGLALNPKGQIVIAGTAGAGLPTTAGAYKTALASGVSAAFASIFDLTKTGAAQLVASSYYGTDTPMANGSGTGNNQIGFTVDANGDVWLGGIAFTPNLPTTANAYQPSLPGLASGCGGFTTLNSAAYFAELSPDLSKLEYATYFSGKTSAANACSEFLNSMAFDTKGNLYVVGGTVSGKFPVTAGVFQGTYPGNGSKSGFVTWVAKFTPSQFTASSSAPVWSSYLGGNGGNTFFGNGQQVVPDRAGNVWIVGQTEGGSNFPITANGYQTSHQGDYDGFAVEISPDGTQTLYGTYLGGSSGSNIAAAAVDSANNLYVAGTTNSRDFPTTADALQGQFGDGCPSGCDGNDMFFATLGSGTIGTIGPVVGGNTGDTTVTISGAGFQSGASCELVQGSTTITAVATTVNSSGTSITCTFALTGAVTGSYDVVVNDSNGSSFTKQAGFTVQGGGQPNLAVSIVGRPVIRTGQSSTFYINVTNSGTQDAYVVPLWISIPSALQYSINGLTPGQSSTVAFVYQGTAYINLFGTDIAAGQTATVPLQITSPADSPSVPITATLQPPWLGSISEAAQAASSASYANGCVADETNPYALNCLGTYLSYLSAASAPVALPSNSGKAVMVTPLSQLSKAAPSDSSNNCANPNAYKKGDADGQAAGKNSIANFPSNPFNSAGVPTSNTYSAGTPDYFLYNAGFYFGYTVGVLNGVSSSAGVSSPLQAELPLDGNSCQLPQNPQPPPPPTLPPPANRNAASKSAIDPNFKSGPTGDASASQYVRNSIPLTYSVGFENEPTATLPAATVVVTDQLDASKVDLTTLSLGSITFGSSVINLPSGTNNYTTTITPPGVTNYVVRIQGSLNTTTGLLKWTFQTIDPTTGLPPSDPTVGFLPPDTDGVVGQGAVLFTVMPKAGLTTGTQITNQASVVFDANAPLNTASWLNTIDANAPVSHVTALPAQETNPNFTVSWSGTDVGSGIATYTIYVSDNGGAYSVWQSSVTTTSASYTGQAGHTYAFYSLATDGAGNTEASKNQPDTSTAVTNGVPTQVQVTVGAGGLPFSVDGTNYASATQTFTWNAGDQHTIAAAASQAGTTGTQYVFTGWSDGGAASHSITVTVGTTSYTATYKTQYLLTTAVSPVNSGTVTGGGVYYDSGSNAPVSASAAANYTFSNWTGSVASANSASTTVPMTGPQSVTANFQGSSVSIYNGSDSKTQGNWTGTYGADGYIIPYAANLPPTYAAVSMSGEAQWDWANPATGARALQISPSSTTRIASTFYSTGNSFNINLNLTDGKSHRIALYLLDWDTTARAQKITIIDANTQQVLDTESYASFQNGVYASWNLTGNIIIQLTRTAGINAVVSGIFFDPAPSTSPAPVISAVNATNISSTAATITWTTNVSATSLVNYGPTAAYGSSSAPSSNPVTSHSVTLTSLTPGTMYNYDVVSANSASTTYSANFTFSTPTSAPPGSSATYNGLDSKTQGNWTGTYGSGGSIIAADANLPPAYATVSMSGQSSWTWANPTSDPRALQVSSGATSRIASTFYSTGNSFNINVNITDGNAHRLVLYLLDWDTTARAETVTIMDASTNAVLDTESYASFHNGVYVSWNVTGNVVVQVARTAGYNSVVAGIFFDTPPAPVAAPTISAINATNITSTSATINWTTNQAASSLVNYGTTTAYGSASTLNPTLVTNHLVTLINLTPGTLYDYDVVSANAANASSTAANFTFTTPSSAGPSASATYLSLDPKTQGAWSGVYGADGFIIANNTTNSIPGYASVSFTGQSTWTWTTNTADPRALQTASGAKTRIASTYYAASNFSVNLNLNDGNTHKVALYLLDWDGGSRVETISILDAGTQSVLSTQAFSNFQNGEYAVWDIEGDVIIQVTRTGGENAVLAAIFFN